MKLDFEQTYLEVADNVMKMTMKPSVESLETKQAFIQSNVAPNVFDQLCFQAEVNIVRQWVLDSGFSLDTYAYDFQKKEIIELNKFADSELAQVIITEPYKFLTKTDTGAI